MVGEGLFQLYFLVRVYGSDSKTMFSYFIVFIKVLQGRSRIVSTIPLGIRIINGFAIAYELTNK